MSETIEAGKLSIGVELDLSELERAASTDLKQRAEAAGTAAAAALSAPLAAALSRMPAHVRGLTEALARNLREEGKGSGAEFVTGMTEGLQSLQKQGLIDPEHFRTLRDALKQEGAQGGAEMSAALKEGVGRAAGEVAESAKQAAGEAASAIARAAQDAGQEARAALSGGLIDTAEVGREAQAAATALSAPFAAALEQMPASVRRMVGELAEGLRAQGKTGGAEFTDGLSEGLESLYRQNFISAEKLRTLQEALGEAGTKGGQALADGVAKTAEKATVEVSAATKRAAEAVTADLVRAFKRAEAQAQRELASGAIDKAEFRRRGQEAADALTQGVEERIQKLGKAGKLDPALLTELEAFKRQGANAGFAMVESLRTQVRAMTSDLRATFNTAMADATEQLALKQIDKKTFQKQAQEAAVEFNNGILAKLKELADSGKLTPELHAALTREMKKAGLDAGQEFDKGAQVGLGNFMQYLKGIFAAGVAAIVLQLFRKVVDIVQDAAAKIRDALNLAGAVQATNAAFESLTAGAQVSGREMRSAMRTASRGLVTDLELIQRASKLLQAEMPLTAQQMGEMVTVSRRLGATLGLDATKALQQFVDGLVSGRPTFLRHLGIITSKEEAVQKWEAATGKASKTLTEQEKAIIFYNDVMEQARRKVAGLGDEQLTASDRVAQLTTMWENLKNGTAAAIAESPRITQFLDSMGNSAETSAEKMERLTQKIGAFIDTVLSISSDDLGWVWKVLGAEVGAMGKVASAGVKFLGMGINTDRLRARQAQFEEQRARKQAIQDEESLVELVRMEKEWREEIKRLEDARPKWQANAAAYSTPELDRLRTEYQLIAHRIRQTGSALQATAETERARAEEARQREAEEERKKREKEAESERKRSAQEQKQAAKGLTDQVREWRRESELGLAAWKQKPTELPQALQQILGLDQQIHALEKQIATARDQAPAGAREMLAARKAERAELEAHARTLDQMRQTATARLDNLARGRSELGELPQGPEAKRVESAFDAARAAALKLRDAENQLMQVRANAQATEGDRLHAEQELLRARDAAAESIRALQTELRAIDWQELIPAEKVGAAMQRVEDALAPDPELTARVQKLGEMFANLTLLGFESFESGLKQASQATEQLAQAEQRLRVARQSGDPAAILAAEREVARARAEVTDVVQRFSGALLKATGDERVMREATAELEAMLARYGLTLADVQEKLDRGLSLTVDGKASTIGAELDRVRAAAQQAADAQIAYQEAVKRTGSENSAEAKAAEARLKQLRGEAERLAKVVAAALTAAGRAGKIPVAQATAAVRELEDALGDAGIEARALAEEMSGLRSAAMIFEGFGRAVLSVADSMGALDDRTRRTLTGVLDLVGALQKAADAKKLVDATGALTSAGTLGMIGAVAMGAGAIVGILGGIAARGKAEGEAQRRAMEAQRQALEEHARTIEGNNRALYDLRLSVDRAAGAFLSAPAGPLAKAQSAAKKPNADYETALIAIGERHRQELQELADRFDVDYVGATEAYLEAERELQARQAREREQMESRYTTEVERALREAGLTQADIERLAKEFGITLNGSVESWRQFWEAIKDSGIEAALASFRTRMELARKEIELFEIKDPAKQLAIYRDTLAKFVDEDLAAILTGFDLDTAEGQAAFQQWVREVFSGIKAGTFDLSQLGTQISIEEFFAWLGEASKLVAETPGGDGKSQSYQVTRTITETTANRMIGVLTTIAYWAERTARLLAGADAALPPEPRFGDGPPTGEQPAAQPPTGPAWSPTDGAEVGHVLEDERAPARAPAPPDLARLMLEMQQAAREAVLVELPPEIRAALVGGGGQAPRPLITPDMLPQLPAPAPSWAGDAAAPTEVHFGPIYVEVTSESDPYQTGRAVGDGIRDSLRQIDQGLGARVVDKNRAAGRPTAPVRV